ncbi:MAG: hypothetical protein ACT4PJ_02720 [Gemmatimonadaceae bacterium]
MPARRRATWRATFLSIALAALSACEPAGRSPRGDTTLAPSVGAVESLPPGAASRRWDASAGNVLLIHDDSVARAVFPRVAELDSTALLNEALVRGMTAEAMSARGSAGSVRVRGFAVGDEECAVWPAVALAADSSGEWTVAFQRGAATPIDLEPIEALASPDSARLAARLARLAGSLPNDTARVFYGLPFVVRSAHRFTAAQGTEVVVAEITRRVNVEANPREENLLLIAERQGGASASWRVTYVERASGDELAVERAIPLAAVRLGASATPTLVLERAGGDWVAYALVQREPDGAWRESWESAHSGC